MNRITAALVLSVLLFFCLSVRESIARVEAVDETVDKPNIAVFFLENLSGRPAPLKEVRQSLIDGMVSAGVPVLIDSSLNRFMARHRIRYTGGIDEATAVAMKTEENVDAVLITEVELYDESALPKIALISRLVSTGQSPRILWMESSASSGDDTMGLLGIGLITDHRILREKVVGSLVRSLSRYLSGGKAEARPVKARYGPKLFYRSDALDQNRKSRLAALPFLNESDRKYGGAIMHLRFIEELVRDGFDVIEPGVVRDTLLNLRIILWGGINIVDADAVSFSLKADLVLAGTTVEYFDVAGSDGAPRVYFSALVLEKATKKIVWSSQSYNAGDDGVFFFDRGKISTAGALSSLMTRNIVSKFAGD